MYWPNASLFFSETNAYDPAAATDGICAGSRPGTYVIAQLLTPAAALAVR